MLHLTVYWKNATLGTVKIPACWKWKKGNLSFSPYLLCHCRRRILSPSLLPAQEYLAASLYAIYSIPNPQQYQPCSIMPEARLWVCTLVLWGPADQMPLACSHTCAPHASPAQPHFCPGRAWIGLFWGNIPVLPSATAPVWTPTDTTRNREQASFLPALRGISFKEHSASHVENKGNSSHQSQQDNPLGIISTHNKKRVSAMFYPALFSHHFFFWVFSKGKL